MNKFCIFLAATVLCTSCTLAPKYERPEMPVDATWPTGPAYESTTSKDEALDATQISWRDFFISKNLQTIIQTTLDNNRDMRIAILNIQVAQDTYRSQRADLFPFIDITGTTDRQRLPKNSFPDQLDNFSLPNIKGFSLPKPERKARHVSEYSANLGTTAYEFDLFGKIQSLTEERRMLYLASKQAMTSTKIALIAEVANAYLTYLADKKLLHLTDQTLAAQSAALDVVKQSFVRGMSSQLAVAQAENTVETARANHYLYTRRLAQDKNALVQLMGTSVDESLFNEITLDSVMLMRELPVGLSSTVLLSRPDIMQAEFVLKAQNANIGAARAAFFPQIDLTGALGFTSDKLHKLFHTGSTYGWNFMSQITQPIFHGGQNIANLDRAETLRDIAIAEYELAIQVAFREVADELAARGTYAGQLQAQSMLVAANQKSYDLSFASYKRGAESYLTVLDSQQDLYNAQQLEIIASQKMLSNLVTLYKVLGGGEI